MGAESNLEAGAFPLASFDAFYDRALPVVYGYLLRLCGGDRQEAWDLTQDSWLAVVDQLAKGDDTKATVGYVVSVARSRYLDSWRRRQRLQRKLRLVWAGERDADSTVVGVSDVMDHLSRCAPKHRIVLMLTYVDELPVAEVSRLLGCSRSSTYSLLARARDELRMQIIGDSK